MTFCRREGYDEEALRLVLNMMQWLADASAPGVVAKQNAEFW